MRTLCILFTRQLFIFFTLVKRLQLGLISLNSVIQYISLNILTFNKMCMKQLLFILIVFLFVTGAEAQNNDKKSASPTKQKIKEPGNAEKELAQRPYSKEQISLPNYPCTMDSSIFTYDSAGNEYHYLYVDSSCLKSNSKFAKKK